MTVDGVVLDWRGTLVTTLSPADWVTTALRRLGRDPSGAAAIVAAIDRPDRLDAPGVDCDAALHRATYLGVFADAGLNPALASALYAVESDVSLNLFAADVAPVLAAVAGHGVRIAVLSDIHVDIRPAFAAAGLDGLIDAYVLSYEHNMQKPDPAIFRLTLDALGTPPERTLMVGDRAGPDGGALAVGMPVLLVPPLRDAAERRLGLVARAVCRTPAADCCA